MKKPPGLRAGCGVQRRRFAGSWRSTVSWFEPLATARSRRPSWLKSPVATVTGLGPVAIRSGARKVPSPPAPARGRAMRSAAGAASARTRRFARVFMGFPTVPGPTSYNARSAKGWEEKSRRPGRRGGPRRGGAMTTGAVEGQARVRRLSIPFIRHFDRLIARYLGGLLPEERRYWLLVLLTGVT